MKMDVKKKEKKKATVSLPYINKGNIRKIYSKAFCFLFLFDSNYLKLPFNIVMVPKLV